jgi:EmrB/QacA subfamily drug resistance transporter
MRRPPAAHIVAVFRGPGRYVSMTTSAKSGGAGSGVGGAGEDGVPGRWQALVVTQLAGFMSLLDVSIVNVAMPSIQRGLGASPATVQWVVSGYALTFGLALVPAGRLGDMLGRRRMFLIALSAFVITSAMTGAAPTAGLLIAARLLQGVAAGMLAPQNSGLIQELFRGDERGKAFGVLGATIGLSTAVGPVVGGLILDTFTGPDGWRWIFYVNVPIGLVALVLAARLVPVTGHRPARRARLDLVGTLLLGGGVLALLLPVVQGEGGGFARLWWLFAVGAVLLAAFAWWEVRLVRRGGEPLLAPGLLRIRGYAAGVCIGLVYFLAYTGIWLVLALYLQNGLGYSPLRSGLAVTPFALGAAVSSAVAGRLVSRLGRRLTVIGLTTAAVGLAATAVVLSRSGTDAAAWAAAAPLFLAGVGGGMVTSPNITLTLESVPVTMAGAAGGALQTAQRIGSALGTAALAAVYFAQLSRTHDDQVAVETALLGAAGFMVLALLLATAELVTRSRDGRRACPPSRPEHLAHHG